MKRMQKQVDDWMSQWKMGYWQPMDMMCRLTEETGELAREVNHRYGPKKKKPTEDTKEMADEMADIIFTVICMANSLGIDLEESFDRMMDKLNNRDKSRYEKK